MCVCIYDYASVCVNICVSIHVCEYMCVCVCKYTYVCTCTVPDFIKFTYYSIWEIHFNKVIVPLCTVIIVMWEFPLHLYVIA